MYKTLRISLLLLCALFSSEQINAQIIVGEVYDSIGSPIEMITISAHRNTDSTLICGDFFIENKIKTRFKTDEIFFIKISKLGYAPTIIKNHEIQHDTINLGIVVLNKTEFNLDEIKVIAQKNIISLNHDGLTLNVANTPLQNLDNLSEVLLNVPSIITSANGGIEVLGRGTPLILIDGKEFYGGNVLNAINPEDIEEIKVLRNPGAKYKATQRSVINVITKKNKKAGMAAFFYERIEIAENARSKTLITLNQTSEKVSNTLTIGGHLGKNKIKEKVGISIDLPDSVNFKNDFKGKSIENYKSIDFNYNMGYNFLKKHTFGVRLLGDFSDKNYTGDLFSNLVEGDSIWNLNSDYIEKEKSRETAINANYSFDIDSLSSFVLVADYSESLVETDKNNIETYTNNTGSNIYGNNIKYNIASVKADYEATIRRNMLKYELGTHWIQTSNRNDSYFTNQQNGNAITNNEFTYNTALTEQVGAFYLNLSKKIKKISLTAGIRNELSKWEIKKNNETINDSTSIDWFPSASAFFTPIEGIKMGLNYSRKINRPNFQTIGRTLSYVNAYLYRENNSNIKPTIIETISFQSMVGSNISFDIDFSQYKNIILLGFSENSNIVVVREENFEMKELSAQLTLTFRNEYFSTNNTFHVSKPWFDYAPSNKSIKTDIGFSINSNNYIYLPKKMELVLRCQYTDKGQMHMVKMQPYLDASVGLLKYYLNKDLRLALFGYYHFDDKSEAKYGDVLMSNSMYRETPAVSFSIWYRINKIKNRSKTDFTSQDEVKNRK